MSDEQTATQTITLKLPGNNERGFLRRVDEVRAIMALSERSNGTIFDTWTAFADYLVEKGYVVAPEGVDVREAMRDMTHAELSRAMFALGGAKLPETVDPQNGG